ncbi:MAG: hypothetical protein NZM40_10115 [Sphingomonadaceae bacterium]|uniref:hypothetical protein n=1 Tax=Thermaurantiacus sp. TaxID=2820283 RepID=UPI00298F1BCF|nr:hypothetical protein [Thermaurantiacus sp.]MCS6987759.1 hypothetical protein [Sphingomonadaceae bacterium]MDW8415021.1 hypothetical protein [Thermaurantiacus sp.]
MDWLRMRAGETSTWVGLAIIAVTLGNDPLKAAQLVQALSLILGGGLVAVGPVPEGEATRPSEPGRGEA